MGSEKTLYSRIAGGNRKKSGTSEKRGKEKGSKRSKRRRGDAIEGPEGSEGGEDGESGLLTSIPAEYAFLLPEGLRPGDVAAENEGSLMLSLPNRTGEDFTAIVERVKNAGYTKDAQEMNMMGIQMYEARNGSKSVTVMFQNGTVIVSIE